ncbi:MAG TPA: hypothetical protein VJC05_02545 [Candidatus Andersenbacteria bacterium]|nr:MAG: hypothetical protein A3E38_02955 [Candidatus Moranbacteria bacterium RIFCSPHIGHO2_12_FULL_54_9]OHB20020.1 MAG: hypothetical protein A2854_01820 [Parcubacteria group bacterium RIFCSPHIGHO2_01_FULL_56_18]HLD25895.1 hypothetical protein [Candidatus Andersenbacteria bacterium]
MIERIRLNLYNAVVPTNGSLGWEQHAFLWPPAPAFDFANKIIENLAVVGQHEGCEVGGRPGLISLLRIAGPVPHCAATCSNRECAVHQRLVITADNNLLTYDDFARACRVALYHEIGLLLLLDADPFLSEIGQDDTLVQEICAEIREEKIRLKWAG